jgi:hypothetical protein
MDKPGEVVTLASVLAEERARLGKADDAPLAGLALSGGGIRSATFNLGVVYSLLERGLLSRFDYLSTVSGGGYIGSWLSALIHRVGGGDARRLEAALDGRDEPTRMRIDAAVHWLRRYSNYLTPRLGLFGSDTLTGVTIYTRNLILNGLILVGALSGGLFLPVLLAKVLSLEWLPIAPITRAHALIVAAALLALVLAFVVGAAAGFPSAVPRLTAVERRKGVGRRVAVLVVGACVLLAFALADLQEAPAGFEWRRMLLWYVPIGGLAYLVFSVVAERVYQRRLAKKVLVARDLDDRPDYTGRGNAFWPFAAGAIGGALLYVLAWLTPCALGPANGVDLCGVPRRAFEEFLTAARAQGYRDLVVAAAGTLLVGAAYWLTIVVHVGFAKRGLSEHDREWIGRWNAYFLKALLVWTGAFAIALIGPTLVHRAEAWLATSGALAWLATSIAGVLAGRSELAKTPAKAAAQKAILAVAPYVFVAGLLILVAWLNQRVAAGLAERWTDPMREVAEVAGFWGQLEKDLSAWALPAWVVAAATAVALALAWGLGKRVDINVFSFQMFYRNRLTRCYLGASRHASVDRPDELWLRTAVSGRRPNPLTDLDPSDDVLLHKLGEPRPSERTGLPPGIQRPYHLINCAINLTSATELAWQQRKAGSFVFSPLYCGYQLPPQGDAATRLEDVVGGFAPTCNYLFLPRPTPKGREAPPLCGPRLGLGMGVSGAAASPASGPYTTPALAFLMTVFNIRLGRWCGNPGVPGAWARPSPRHALGPLFHELLGRADERKPFVYLSDGGHFENLGLYELVRRRCRLIVVSDAACDPMYQFNDLANAIRKCRIDFGVEIDLPYERIRPAVGSRHSEAQAVPGTIVYPAQGNRPRVEGRIVYIKASLQAHLPADIGHYAAVEEDFPHQTTADQWFDEPQFESYRRLGKLICDANVNAATFGPV